MENKFLEYARKTVQRAYLLSLVFGPTAMYHIHLTCIQRKHCINLVVKQGMLWLFSGELQFLHLLLACLIEHEEKKTDKQIYFRNN